MSSIEELVEKYVRRVRELADHVKGNEQATKQSLIGPFLTMLGYDLTDPRECIPEYKVDFGKDRSSKPIDWAFLNGGNYAFFVEAKEVGRKLAGYDEQLADYFAKDPNVKLGILTNGAQWKFFTDVEHANVMDKEPFARWDILADDAAPLDVLKLLQKSQFNPELIRAFAQRKRAQNLLLSELTRLLEPSSEFTKLAVANLETRNLTQAVVDTWKPIVASAIDEWAKQRMLNTVLNAPSPSDSQEGSKIETTKEELDAFETVKRHLGKELPVAFEDSVAYFKIHLAEKRTWVMSRLQLNRKTPLAWVPLSQSEAEPHASGRALSANGLWTTVALDSVDDLQGMGPLFRAAYEKVKRSRSEGIDEA